MSLQYYPAFINLDRKECVVVGGGRIAERKTCSLLIAGARVRVISPEITAALERKLAGGLITHVKRRYRRGDLAGSFLVVAATSDEIVNRKVSEDAPCLINVVDVPGLSNFILPSVMRRGPLTIAVSTSGASPAMAASIRKELETLYDRDFASFTVFLKGLRKKALRKLPDKMAREKFLIDSASHSVLKSLRSDGAAKTTEAVMACFNEACRLAGKKTGHAR